VAKEKPTKEELFADGPWIRLEQDGAVIISEKLSEQLAKKNLSASLVTALTEGCNARWLAETFVLKELLPVAPDNAATRGSIFHKVMELFFAVEPEKRTPELIRKLSDDVLASDEFKDSVTPDTIEWLRGAINGYYNMGGKPEKVQVAKFPRKNRQGEYEDVLGLEIFVKGKIGDTEREILGLVDQVLVDPREPDAVVVQDWKALALDTEILTSDGWTTMGKLRVGNFVYGSNKEWIEVLGKSEVHYGKDCYKLTFNDGMEVVADAEHLWPVAYNQATSKIVFDETGEIIYPRETYEKIGMSKTENLFEMSYDKDISNIRIGDFILLKVEKVESVPTQCINVDAEDSIFLITKSFIPTHNSGKVHRWDPNTKDMTGFAEQRQQIIYSKLLEQEGIKVSAARLIFSAYEEQVKVPLDDEEMNKRVIETIEEADRTLSNNIKNNKFEYSPSFLCSWCPIWRICNKAEPLRANMRPDSKPVLARESQPMPEEYELGIVC